MEDPFGHATVNRSNFYEMILMHARSNRAIPNRQPANLVLAAVTLDDEEVAGSNEQLWEFGVFNADMFNLPKPQFVRIHIRDAKVWKLLREFRSLGILRQTAKHEA